MRRFFLCLCGAALLAAGGCSSLEPFGLWYGPHTTSESQRAQAQYVDPYPSREAGPELIGGRPRDYDLPRAEPVRVQKNRWELFPGW